MMVTDRPPMPLCDEAVWRKARKQWRCQCPGGAGKCPHTMCQRTIEPGTDYVEYLGEATPYSHGKAYCPPCGADTWAAEKWTAETLKQESDRALAAPHFQISHLPGDRWRPECSCGWTSNPTLTKREARLTGLEHLDKSHDPDEALLTQIFGEPPVASS